ncbi:MAG: sugar ABC transporter ATP-binding protein [Phycisphaerales bacterium]|nr:sugar ABC transporter ATP-binding protein [Phycisphaerales bacterium]
MVEIAKALSCQAKILILDEPTAVLTAHEKYALFRQMRELKAAGVTLIYISHHLSEVIDLCDCVTVLRDGELVTTLDRGDIKSGHDGERQLASLMVGRVMGDYFPPRPRHTDRVMLEIIDFRVGHQADASPVNLKIAAGEIVGLAGLVGAGRTELAESLVSLRSIAGGRVTIDGKPVVIRNPAQAMAQGLVYLSEDRRGAGLLLDMSIADNINLAALTHGQRGWLNWQAQLTVTQRHVDKLGIRISHPYAPVATLSGGNQQKVALAKWLEVNPKVLILDEPTRGVDIGAKKEIYQLIVQLAQQGMACLLISSEMNELLGLCHRIAVLRAGQLVANLSVGEATEEIILQHAAGIKQVGIQAIEGVGHQR